MQVIDEIRHSVDALWALPPDLQLRARLVYYDGLRYAFAASTAAAAVAVVASLFATATKMRRTH